ncbi:MAG: SH3 domain-containing protein [Prevotella sp.]|nr:SH3 domain-containing protein [Prevotella sp.]
MKKRIYCLLAMMVMLSTAMAQKLVLVGRYGKVWKTESVSNKNKPNGNMFRLRKDVQRTDLPRVPETEGLELYISEPIDMGWLGFYRLPTSDDNYNFVVVIYNNDLKPIHVLNLCDIANNRYCEVQDVRWDADNHNLLFNMACPSYAELINGKGSKLYCYSVADKRIVWETDYLVSNDIFILNDKYVFCSYGFTSEKKFLYMLDKLTGKVYSKLPMVYKVEYMELQEVNGREMLYVVDYNDNLYTYNISNGQTAAKSSGMQKPKVFTVVYATSNDGFLNVRAGASTKSKVLTKLYGQMHGLGSGVLLEKGNTWSKISVDRVTGWVYNKYLGSQNWYDGSGKTVLIANRDNMPIYGENYVGEGDYPVFTTVPKGTVIADQYDEHGDYYELKTGHDYLFIKKNDVRIEKK